METRVIDGVLSKLHMDGNTWVREDKDRVCHVGHALTGQEKRDCTYTLRCGTCAKLRSKGWSNPRGMSGARYRDKMLNTHIEEENMPEKWS